ncbi:hypothetical protein BDV97DRAFT_221094 [Delphinella strobiligena]|nr:hypothetical protein BDV97DRAFT_221094 [Delphinella strobiligena]
MYLPAQRTFFTVYRAQPGTSRASIASLPSTMPDRVSIRHSSTRHWEVWSHLEQRLSDNSGVTRLRSGNHVVYPCRTTPSFSRSLSAWSPAANRLLFVQLTPWKFRVRHQEQGQGPEIKICAPTYDNGISLPNGLTYWMRKPHLVSASGQASATRKVRIKVTTRFVMTLHPVPQAFLVDLSRGSIRCITGKTKPTTSAAAVRVDTRRTKPTTSKSSLALPQERLLRAHHPAMQSSVKTRRRVRRGTPSNGTRVGP